MDVRAPQSETTHIPLTQRTTWNSISNRHATDGDTYTENSLEKLHFHMADVCVCLCVWFPFFPTKKEVKKLRMSWGWMHYLQTKYSWRCAQLAIFPIHLIQFFHAAASAVAVLFFLSSFGVFAQFGFSLLSSRLVDDFPSMRKWKAA